MFSDVVCLACQLHLLLLINPSQNSMLPWNPMVPHISSFHMLSSLFEPLFSLWAGVSISLLRYSIRKTFLFPVPYGKVFGFCHLYSSDSQGCQISPLSSRLCIFLDIDMHPTQNQFLDFCHIFPTKGLHFPQVVLT